MTKRKPRSAMFRLKVFEAAGGACHICERKIQSGEGWEVEHVIPLALGGEDTEANMRPAHKDCHGRKTRADNASWTKAKRVRAKHLGIRKPSKWQTKFRRKMDGTVEIRK